MPANPGHQSVVDEFIDFVKSVNVLVAILIIPAWKYIDKLFEYKKSKDKEFIKSAAKEGVREEIGAVNSKIDDLKEDIKGIIRQAEQDRKDTNKQLMDIIREQRK